MLTLYNSLSKKLETLKQKKSVGVYTCGPTVYDYVTVGNWRTYALGDLVVRTLEYLGHEVNYVMNITDVGHLTGDNEGDADTGEDRMQKAAKRERKTAWEVAAMYTDDFLDGFSELGFRTPDAFCKATEHVDEQIAMVKQIEQAGFTYKISDGIYFDVGAYEAAGYEYGELSNIDQVKEGARVEPNPEKKDPRDFALWKFNTTGQTRDMEWESPWGKGFPGWHIECSAMSTKYLGEQFEIHIGGEDLRSTHHPNEIAQAEAATGKKPFVKYWIHGAFLQVDGGRMGKSLGNAYTLHDVAERSFDPLDLKYFYLTGHYRKPLNFTWEALEAAKKARKKLIRHLANLDVSGLGKDSNIEEQPYYASFVDALKHDFNAPMALGVLWEMITDSQLLDEEKIALAVSFDEVLGLGLLSGVEAMSRVSEVPVEVTELVEQREAARQEGEYAQADTLREKIEDLGYRVLDTGDGVKIEPR